MILNLRGHARRHGAMNRFLMGGALGGALVYMLDCERGVERRQRMESFWRDNRGTARQAGRMAANAAETVRPWAGQVGERLSSGWPVTRSRRARAGGAARVVATAALAGTLVYFLDPDRGQARRQRLLSLLKGKQASAMTAGKQAVSEAADAA